MLDPRYTQLARTLVGHSLNIKPGEKVLVEAFDIPADFTVEMIRAIEEAGGSTLVSTYQQPVLRALFRSATEDQMAAIGQVEKLRMESVQCYIGLRGSNNISEYSDVPRERMDLYERLWWKPVHSETRIGKTRWVVLRWPSSSMAQSAGMSTQQFEDFYFQVCAGVDYSRMASAMEPLVDMLNQGDQVHITGPGTDLTFSIKDMPAIPCAGGCNIPDGEIFTCPVKTSVNGVITHNAETLYRGSVFQGIRLEFRDGKIVTAEAGGLTGKLNEILDADEGARYIGEWALGVNPYITKPMRDILFDEKIAGSFHFTPGNAYDECDNGNRSQVHWDMVSIQTPEYGGGEIHLDRTLLRKDGLFVPEALQVLNPDQLKG